MGEGSVPDVDIRHLSMHGTRCVHLVVHQDQIALLSSEALLEWTSLQNYTTIQVEAGRPCLGTENMFVEYFRTKRNLI